MSQLGQEPPSSGSCEQVRSPIQSGRKRQKSRRWPSNVGFVVLSRSCTQASSTAADSHNATFAAHAMSHLFGTSRCRRREPSTASNPDDRDPCSGAAIWHIAMPVAGAGHNINSGLLARAGEIFAAKGRVPRMFLSRTPRPRRSRRDWQDPMGVPSLIFVSIPRRFPIIRTHGTPNTTQCTRSLRDPVRG